MKAVAGMMITISLLMGISLSANGANSQINEESSAGEADVYGYHQDPVFEEGYYIGDIVNGFAEVYPDIGVTINITLDDAYDGLKFVIVDVSRFYDESTLDAMAQSFDEGATVIPFYMFYVDEVYDTVEVDATYTITIIEGKGMNLDFRDCALYYLEDGGDSIPEKLETITDANAMTYSSELTGDFILVNNSSDNEGNDDVAQTGDDNKVVLWLCILVGACTYIAATTVDRMNYLNDSEF